ncbi:MAG: M15 family metallopeptidase [Clostridia bacterium]|nr:M15 family metallopeptidase [Clostridia bacterium]
MPYKRYDIKNKYNYRGRRVNEHVVLKTFMLFFIPVLILIVMGLGILLAYRVEVGPLFDDSSDATVDQVQIVSDEELLIVVNNHNQINADYVPELRDLAGIQVSEIAYDNLLSLTSDAAADGVNISISAGYVSYDQQNVLYEETFKKLKEDKKISNIKAESETRKICPEAGSSESQTGLLIKFSTSEVHEDFSDTAASVWLEHNAVNYGFILRYPEDEEVITGMAYAPDYYRYVGKEHALNIRRYDMTLEEYSSHVSQR